jgi:Domain of unknown function (DUF4365)
MKRKKTNGDRPANDSNRLTPKEIGRVAGRLFANSLPPHWAVRTQEDQEDYGVDYEIEVTTSDDQPTGFIFKVQQKGTEKAKLVKSGAFVAYSDLERSKIDYYLNRLRIPIVLVVVDISTQRIYWLPLQGNTHVKSRLKEAVAKRHNKVTLHLPINNGLPSTSGLLLRAVRNMMNSITVASVSEIQPFDLGALLDTGHKIDDIDLRLRMAQLAVRSARTKQLIDEGRFQDALTMNEKAFADDAEPMDARFAAGLEIIRVVTGVNVHNPHGDPEEPLKIRVAICNKLVRLTLGLPANDRLRHYAIFLARTSRLRVAIYRDMGVFMNRRSQLAGIDEYTKLLTAGAQQRTTSEVIKHLRRLQYRMTEFIGGGWLELMIHGWSEATESLGHFLLRLNSDELSEAADAIRRWLDIVGSAARTVAQTVTDINLVGLCALNHVRIGFGTDSITRRIEEARGLISVLPDPAAQELLRERLQMLAEFAATTPARIDVNDHAPEVPDPVAVEQMVRQMARGLGVDIDDPNDDIAQVLRVGIRDHNPERVLRECRYLYVRLGSYGIPAQMMGLPTAGSKEICCTRHNYRTGAFSLDAGYAFFKVSHCARCSDCSPHPSEWKWSLSYQEAQFEKHDSQWPEAMAFGIDRRR